ncbi:flagellar motor switch protein FliM [Arthrobacter sp.]|uniref:flagellar motor switch protein FliM n=1 Tax=Arthrobacter sp. TaxID=1667 RepID=UPI003A94438E
MTVSSVDRPAVGAPDPESPPTRAVQVYDFRRPATLAREHSRILELAFETFARQWGTQLTAKVRVMSQVTLSGVCMSTYDDYVSDLPATTAMILCDIEGLEAKAVVQFPAAGALNWASHMLGSPTPVDVPERKFTRIELTLLRRMLDETLEDLHYSMGSLLESPLTVDTVQYNSQFAQAAPKSEVFIVATFTVRVGERSIISTIALPADAVLPQLDAAHTSQHADAGTGTPAERIARQLAAIPIDVALELTPKLVTPQFVLDLSVGDVLSLPHPSHQPLQLSVDGRRLGRAAVGTRNGRIAAVIVSTEENPA